MNWSRKLRACVAVGLLAVSASAMAGPSGAIFTNDENSNLVNANVYEGTGYVYLNGGPRANAPCTAAGLPDDDYYFQVTDPSGQDLLSSDAVENRRVTVMGGVIIATAGSHGIGT